MNPQFYITADLVNRNSQLQQLQQLQQAQQAQQQLVVNDVFEIPEYNVSVPVPVTVPVPVPVPVTVPVSSNIPQPPAFTTTDNMNFIKSINHTAMTDVMNQLAKQKQKTPSVGTKQTDVSLQVPQTQPQTQLQGTQPFRAVSTTANGGISAQPTNPAGLATLATIPLSETGILETAAVTGTTKKITPKYVTKNTLNKKVIIEEEDRDSAIDYDDDDTEIKKTKLSLFQFAKDITFNLIFAIPFLQKARLHAMLRDSTLAINQIERIFDEFKDRFSQYDLECIKKYICEDGIRDQLNYILETGFNKILSDGIIDVNDAPQFNQLVYYIIKSFNDINQGKVYRFYVSREHVMLLLHFVLKSVFSLTLKGQEEQMALGLLDTSFKLVQLEVLPIVSKRWYHRFRICRTAKQIEDIIE